MTIEEAGEILRRRGLIVQLVPDNITVAARPYEPNAAVKTQGVEVAYAFGFSIYRVDREWAFRHSPPRPAEWFDDLDAALARALEYCEECSLYARK